MAKITRAGVPLGAAIAILSAIAGCTPRRPQTAPARTEPVTVVVLPPQVQGKGDRMVAAAETLSDLLAERTGKDGAIRVVNRTQLQRVLAERRATTQPLRTMVAYDAMVRVSVDLLRADPEVSVSVVDLSMGNLIASKTYPWQGEPDDEALADMAELCRKAAMTAARGPAGRLKVRYVAGQYHDRMARRKPLADRLGEMLRKRLAALPNVVVVQHLEAASSVEESLFLLLGLTRLPGGRTFAPQADAGIELRITEVDPFGKTFEETPVEVSFRLADGEWSSVMGTYGKADELAEDLWAAVAKAVSACKADDASQGVPESVLRRRQAEAELNRYAYWVGYYDLESRYGDALPQVLAEMHEAAARAAKLDPTWEKAAFMEILFAHHRARCARVYEKSSREDAAMARRLLDASLNYLDRFPDNAEHRATAYWYVKRLCEKATTGLSARERADLLASLAERAVSERPDGHFLECCGGLIRAAYRHMRQAGVPVGTCLTWQKQLFDRAYARLEAVREVGVQGRHVWLNPHITNEQWCWKYWTGEAWAELELALSEDRREWAMKIVEDVMATLSPRQRRGAFTMSLWERELKKLGGKALWQRFCAWQNGKTVETEPRYVYRMSWPTGRPQPKGPFPEVRYFKPTYKEHGVHVCNVIGGRMYVLIGDPRYAKHVGYIPLDAAGRPTSDVEWLSKLGVTLSRASHSTVTVGGKVYSVGRNNRGRIRVRDTATGKERFITPADGLPARKVSKFFRLDDRTVLVTGDGSGARVVAFTIDTESGALRLYRRKYPPGPISRIGSVWRDGDAVRAATLCGIYENLLDNDCEVRRGGGGVWWEKYSPHDKLTYRPKTARGRLDITGTRSGVVVSTEQGDVLHDWRGSAPAEMGLRALHVDDFESLGTLPYTCPKPGVRGIALIGHDGACAYLKYGHSPLGGPGSGPTLCYDPEKEIWYGPVRIAGEAPLDQIGKGPGVWLDGAFVSTADVMAAARKAGLAASTAELEKHRQTWYDGEAPLDRAKYAFGLGQFDKAYEILQDALKTNAKSVDALLLSAMILGKYGKRDTEQAVRFCRRAAEATDRPDVRFTSALLEFELYRDGGRWNDALAAGRRILERPKLGRYYDTYVRREMRKITARLEKNGTEKETEH